LEAEVEAPGRGHFLAEAPQHMALLVPLSLIIAVSILVDYFAQIFTVFVQFLFSFCSVFVQFLFSFCSVFVQFRFSLGSVFVQFLFINCIQIIILLIKIKNKALYYSKSRNGGSRSVRK
jgi:hypothetical protein